MAYVVVKTIKGRRYRYLQRSWREGKKVRTSATCLGRVSGSVGCGALDENMKRRHEWLKEYARDMAAVEREEKKFAEWQRKTFGETGEERHERQQREKLDELHEKFGLKMPGDAPSEEKE